MKKSKKHKKSKIAIDVSLQDYKQLCKIAKEASTTPEVVLQAILVLYVSKRAKK